MSRFERPSPRSRSTSVSRRLSDPRLLGPGAPLRAERSHQRSRRVRIPCRPECLELVSRVSCRLDRRRRRLRPSAGELEPGLRGLQPEPQPRESVDGLLKEVDGVRLPAAARPAPREIAAASTRSRPDCIGDAARGPPRRSCLEHAASASRAWTSCSRSGAASRFVQPISSRRATSSASAAACLAAGEAHRNGRADSVGIALEPGEELLRLVEATLEDTDLGQPRGRGHAARSLAGLGQLPYRRDELRLGGVDSTVGGEDVGAARAAEREQGHVVVLPHELVEDLAPLLRPLGVARPLAREHQRAADVGERLELVGSPLVAAAIASSR